MLCWFYFLKLQETTAGLQGQRLQELQCSSVWYMRELSETQTEEQVHAEVCDLRLFFSVSEPYCTVPYRTVPTDNTEQVEYLIK